MFGQLGEIVFRELGGIVFLQRWVGRVFRAHFILWQVDFFRLISYIYASSGHAQDIANMFRKQLLSLDALKRFHDYVRCARYPDVEAFERSRVDIEAGWPTYSSDYSLCRAPAYAWDSLRSVPPAHLAQSSSLQQWRCEGEQWQQLRNHRAQHVLAHMNHHIHPLVNPDTGERRLLTGCRSKKQPKVCKSGFPLDNQMTDVPLLICPCLARERGLPTSGPRSSIGTILPSRNHAWLNAAPLAWSEFAGDNGDIKFPIRVPILPETHEVLKYDVRNCVSESSVLDMAYEVQVGQAVTAGYFGGYSAKMQEVGKKELESMRRALTRKVEGEPDNVEAKSFRHYSGRLLRDLEGKGIIRTTVETVNLAMEAPNSDILAAECFRTFPSVTFPASLLLKREEIETKKIQGVSVIAAIFAGGGVF